MAHPVEHNDEGLYGLMAEYADADGLVQGIKKIRQAGYKEVDAFTPQPEHAVNDALGAKTIIPWIVLAGGVAGLLIGFGLQYWSSAIAYPLNVGGRPLNSWISFLPVTFEMTVLLAGLSAVFGTLALAGLPMPYHPVFNVPKFTEKNSRDGFFLLVKAEDPHFDYEQTQFLMSQSGAEGVYDVPK
ncbi:MAG: DUF3341 domain-containing protein [Anaerolineales bacterium]|nr:DUF3341 domain-containing protein [Anaerolineales bacterium]MCB9126529.1 DUF3341 domain-containing protein [Ardenticatenales bacterium]